MATIVVPYRSGGKSRLPKPIRVELGLAMLEDVLMATTSVAATIVVTDDDDGAAATLASRLGAIVVTDPGGGQGIAVGAALAMTDGPCIVVNSDLPAATVEDVAQLLDAAHAGRFAIVEAADGTTNALALPTPTAFRPLYGQQSAARFRAHAVHSGFTLAELDTPSLALDVDTTVDLDRVAADAGPKTRQQLGLVG